VAEKRGLPTTVASPGRWWRTRTSVQRFELYTRISLFFLPAVALFIVLGSIGSAGSLNRDVMWVYLAVVAAQAVYAVVLMHRLLPYGRTIASVSRSAWTGFAAVSVVAATLSQSTLPVFIQGDDYSGFYGMLLVAAMAALVVGLRLSGRTILVVAVAAGGAFAAVAWVQTAGDAVMAAGIPGGATLLGIMFASRLSAWMLDVVVDLDRAQQMSARLAVAEERLRFSRDLHDVMGRNLSVIAVRTQLAEQLARRGRDDAADEMAQVRGIAEESLREVRDVIRGYRSTDLAAELVGARSVLGAAAVDTHIRGDASTLSPDVQTTLGWVVREATTNVLRHSDATTCVIELTTGSDTVTLRVENDRPHPPVRSGDGSGLRGLTERLRTIGADLATEHTGEHFRLRVVVPGDVTVPDDVSEAPVP